ncbi:CUB and sushi domain-containing protein 1-like [Ctenocephalides felis]|uniref:CUB and sushi domain-containing protein 1-like n=1 Tax=Ctenocephalides felis TaxID=7515 RepID=UPI000E6E28DD|nr:CUB and sushi domain-containing protein 1-like [Ctenocephalides felis]
MKVTTFTANTPLPPPPRVATIPFYCLTPPTIEHARHSALPEQATFDLDSTVQYHCHMGYATNGFPRAKCLAIDGKASWYGPDISCEPRTCGPPADPAHGWHAGECYTYGCRVIYHCAEGFELVGKEERFCQADGSWAPKDLPMCVLVTAVQCAPPESPRNGKAVYTSCAYNSVVSYECKYGYTLVGEGSRRCGADKKWSGILPQCKEINCGHPGNLHNGWIENIEAGTGLGASVIFRCHENMLLQGHTSSVCQIDGKWRYPLPQCLAPCVVPQVDQGRVVLSIADNVTTAVSTDSTVSSSIVVSHGEGLTVECDANYEFPQAGLAPVTCNNGTWTLIPRCVPARCKHMPKAPKNGMVIAPKMDHGMKARFQCKDGFQLKGNTDPPFELVCSFGNWTGEPPTCQEVYCPFPGYIENGKVLLVGNMGLYDYRPYVRKVINNKQIMYDCDKGYVLSERGPPGATCIGGNWSPKELPSCLPGQHPRLRWSRKRRSLVSRRRRVLYMKYLAMKNGLFKKPLAQENAESNEVTQRKRRDTHRHSDLSKSLVSDIFLRNNRNLKRRSGHISKGEGPSHQDRGNGQQRPKPGSHQSIMDFVPSRMERALQRESYRGTSHKEDGKRSNRRQGGGANQTSLTVHPDGREESVTKKPKSKGPCEALSSEPYVNIEIVRTGRDPSIPYSTGTVVRMACGKGYGLNIKPADATAKCVRGRWKPAKPMCLILPCIVPTTPYGIYSLSTAGSSTLGNWTVLQPNEEVGNGQVVEFSCETGFSTQGPNNMRCWHGDWTVSSLPECIPGPCQLPVAPNAQYMGGYRAGLTIAHGSSVTVHCEGNSSNPITLSCDYAALTPATIQCRLPEIAKDIPDEFLGGSDIVKGGEMNVFGETDGRPCGPPARVQGSVIYRDGEPLDEESAANAYPAGTEMTFNCIASVLGERTTWRIVCEDGSWVGRSLNCDGDDKIDHTPVLSNGSCVFRNNEPHVVSFYNDQEIRDEVVEFAPGSVLVSRCVDIGKYAMIGSSRRRCIGAGEWDGQKPACFGLNQENDYAMEKPPTILFRHQLGPIAQSNDGRLIVYPGTILHMECLWMRRFGNPKWTVSHEYRKYPEGWSTDPGRDAQLEYRLSIYHAARDDSGLFTCVTPARHTHSVEIVVKAVHCPVMPTRRGVAINTAATRMGTKLQLSCTNGNTMIGASELTCLPSGNWSAPFPVCESTECGEVPMIPTNASSPRVSVLSREVGGSALFSCPAGYGIRGPQEAACLPGGEWSQPFPICVEVQCENPGSPLHGYAQGTGPYKAGDVVQFNCNPEFMMQGQPIIACQESGRWSGPVPQCVQACSYPGTAISGRMSSVKFYYRIGETVTFTCDPGLQLRGARMLRCLRNGKWSNAIPTCAPPDQKEN